MDNEQRNRTVYVIREVAKGVLLKEIVTSTNDEKSAIQLVVGEKEPYLWIVPLVTKALFTESYKDVQLPNNYVQHIHEVCGEIMSLYPSSDFTHFSIREHLNKFSVLK